AFDHRNLEAGHLFLGLSSAQKTCIYDIVSITSRATLLFQGHRYQTAEGPNAGLRPLRSPRRVPCSPQPGTGGNPAPHPTGTAASMHTDATDFCTAQWFDCGPSSRKLACKAGRLIAWLRTELRPRRVRRDWIHGLCLARDGGNGSPSTKGL